MMLGSLSMAAAALNAVVGGGVGWGGWLCGVSGIDGDVRAPLIPVARHCGRAEGGEGNLLAGGKGPASTAASAASNAAAAAEGRSGEVRS